MLEARRLSDVDIIKELKLLVDEAKAACQKCRKNGLYHCGICAYSDIKLQLIEILEQLRKP